MDDKILDRDLYGFHIKERTPFKYFIVLLIMWAGLIINITLNSNPNYKFLASFLLLLVVSITMFYSKTIGKYATLALTVLGVFSIIGFLPFKVTFWIFSPLFSIDVLHLFLMLYQLTIVGNEILPPRSKKGSRNAKLDLTLVTNFEKKFALKTKTELSQISQDYRMTPEAIAAAKNLLNSLGNQQQES